MNIYTSLVDDVNTIRRLIAPIYGWDLSKSRIILSNCYKFFLSPDEQIELQKFAISDGIGNCVDSVWCGYSKSKDTLVVKARNDK